MNAATLLHSAPLVIALASAPGLLVVALIASRLRRSNKMDDLRRTGARAWLVLGFGLGSAALTGASAVLSIAGLTSYDRLTAIIPAFSYLLLAWGLWRWLDGKSTLLRLAGLLLPLVLLGPPAVSFPGDTDTLDSLVRVALTLVAATGPALAALGSALRPRRPGIDWTA